MRIQLILSISIILISQASLAIPNINPKDTYALDTIQHIEKININGIIDKKDEILKFFSKKELPLMVNVGAVNYTSYALKGNIVKVELKFDGDRETLLKTYYLNEKSEVFFIEHKYSVFEPPKWEEGSKEKSSSKTEYYLANERIRKTVGNNILKDSAIFLEIDKINQLMNHYYSNKNEKGNKIGEAFLLGFDKVKLYNKIEGKEIGEIQNDEIEEVYYSLHVYDQKNDWFKVQAVAMGDTLSGWILNESYLATYSRNYSDTLFVYSNMDEKQTVCAISEYFTSPMKIEEFRRDWVKVKFENSSLSCQGGWIMQNMTCSSPYTTCP